MRKIVVFSILAIACAIMARASEKRSLTSPELERYRLAVMPLPQQMEIDGIVRLNAADLGVAFQNPMPENAKALVDEFNAWYKERTGVSPTGKAWQIVVCLGASSPSSPPETRKTAEALKKRPNSEQAYGIGPIPNNKLAIVALNYDGLYYALGTLRQLLSVNIAPSGVTLPLVRIEDWPDMGERGIWNMIVAPEFIARFGEMKLNALDNTQLYSFRFRKTADGVTYVPTFDAESYALARKNAIRWPGRIMHLNMWRSGMMDGDCYPELQGKGKTAVQIGDVSGQRVAPCASNPLLRELLTRITRDMAAKGISEIDGWNSEYYCYCACDACKAAAGGEEGQEILENRAFVSAWEEARKEYPELKLRIFSSSFFPTNDDEERHRRQARVYSEIPPEVGIGRLGRYYPIPFEGRDVMYEPPIAEKARRGCRVYSYQAPSITTTPFMYDIAATRNVLRCYQRQKWSGAYAFAMFDAKSSDMDYALYRMRAMAEWAWNANGRTIEEFAKAWAFKKKIKSPDAFASWARQVSPLMADLNQTYFFRMQMKVWARRVKASLESGKPMDPKDYSFRYFSDIAALDKALKSGQDALAAARDLNEPDSIEETELLIHWLSAWRQASVITGSIGCAGKYDAAASAKARAIMINDLEKWRVLFERVWKNRLKSRLSQAVWSRNYGNLENDWLLPANELINFLRASTSQTPSRAEAR